MVPGTAVVLALVPLFFPPRPSTPIQEGSQPVAQEDLDAAWADGLAEVCGYRWKGARDGAVRTGEIVAILATEPFSAVQHVRVDRPTEDVGEVITALRLELLRSFRTGVTDVRATSSTYLRADDLSPLKFTFSSSDWNGQTYEEIDVNLKALALDVRSYLQDESVRKTIARKPDGLVGDQLFVWMRGLRGAPIEPGASKSVPLLTDAFERRARHSEALWGIAVITRDAESAPHEVPAGTFPAIAYRIKTSDGRVGEVWIEEPSPHRVLAWKWTRLEELLDSAELTGTQRWKVREMLDDGQAVQRVALGLGD